MDFINFAHQQFEASDIYYGHGTGNAWDEACALVLDALDLSHNISDEKLNVPLEQLQLQIANPGERLSLLIDRRVNEQVPVPYLTNKAWFAGLAFYIDERALIPRSPVAQPLVEGFGPWLEADKVTRVLDLCTGSACIAIACAFAFPNAQVDAVDLSSDALEVAKKNVTLHQLEKRVHLYEGDLFAPVENQKYDFIISNPPYVGLAEMKSLPSEYQHEPDLALEAGTLGLDIVDRILREAKNLLNDGGVLVVEVGNTDEAVDCAYPDMSFLWLDFEEGGHGVFLLERDQL
jgi:ribosomal protein L3 glutamine methyltransferase